MDNFCCRKSFKSISEWTFAGFMGDTIPRKDISVAEKSFCNQIYFWMNVCIVHGGHGKERIYLLQKKYYIYISESLYQSEKLARGISVGEKISTIIIQNDGMFA